MTNVRVTGPALSALVVGTDGVIGHALLRDVLASKRFTRVCACGKTTSELSESEQGRVEQRVIDFDQLERESEEGRLLRDGRWDVIFVALDASQSSSTDEIERVEREYAVRVARAVKSEDAAHQQRFIFLSSAGADPAASKFYPQNKGLAEKDLASFAFEDFIVFRPSFITGAHFRFSDIYMRPFAGVVSVFHPEISVPIHALTQSMAFAGELGSAQLRADDKTTDSWDGPSFTAVSSAQMKRVINRVYM